MTRRDAKEYLINMSYKLGNMAVEYLTEKDGEKMREAINALEQDRTLEQESVLDKIRSEIKDWQTDIHDNEYDAENYDFVFEEIFEIIDKYRKGE